MALASEGDLNSYALLMLSSSSYVSHYIQLFLRVNWSKLAKTGQKVAKFPGKFADGGMNIHTSILAILVDNQWHCC
jgi:hypothetical protein